MSATGLPAFVSVLARPANTLPLMPERAIEQVRETLDAIYRADSARILAMLIRLLGDFNFMGRRPAGARNQASSS